jgi:EF hand
MAMTPTVSRVLAISFGAALAGIAACAQGERPAGETRASLVDDLPVPTGAAEQVEHLRQLRALYDEDGDGFVSPAEAEGYYRRYFDQLDDNNDGRLSRAELEPETPGVPDLEVAEEELVGASEQEYVDGSLRKYNLRADPTVGMMSTADFDEMVGEPDAAISTPRPEAVP